MNPPESALPGLPRDAAGGPVFAEPWQARAFALTLALHEAGAFGWSEWSAALAAELKGSGDPQDYYQAWLGALERIVAERGLAEPETVAALAERWRRAAAATPHGRPIRLESAPRAPL